MTSTTTSTDASASTAKIEGIYISRRSAGPIESKDTAKLIPGKGIDGDRYATGTGTYSAKFMSEPGKNLTMVSFEGIVEATKRTGMAPFRKDNIGEMRRNIVLSGISPEALNDMIGHEVLIGNNCRVFVHRRCVPCKYREAACKRPGLMNNLWGVSGVNCEILSPLKNKSSNTDICEIKVGDRVSIIPNTHQPERINVGRKPPGFFIRPADRKTEEIKKMTVPPFIAGMACLLDPEGFQRVENAYNSVGLRFWTPDAYGIGLLVKVIRIPMLVMIVVALLWVAIGAGLHLIGIEL